MINSPSLRPAPTPTASPADPERELKFIVPEGRVAVVGGLLNGLCRPDAVHPPARVVTVYFDTPGFQLLDEKVNSDYLKTKIRVRWYEGLEGRDAGDVVFVECKYRVGTIRRKVRVRAPEEARRVALWGLERPEWLTLVAHLRQEGVTVPPDVAAVARLAYVRQRFRDPVTGARLTFDTDMTVQAVNPSRLPPGFAGPLPGAVVEYKDSGTDLPRHLRLLVEAGARKASFSKYLAGYLHVTREIP